MIIVFLDHTKINTSVEDLNHPLDQNYATPAGLHINDQSRDYLAEAGKWGKFLGIMGFVMVGFLVMISFFMGSLLTAVTGLSGTSLPFSPLVFTTLYLIIAAFLFMPALYLYRFSVQAQAAVRRDDQAALNASLANLKSLLKFYGLLTAIVLAFYALIFVFAVLSGGIAAAL